MSSKQPHTESQRRNPNVVQLETVDYALLGMVAL